MHSRLQLVCPLEHDIYFNLNGDGYAEPVTGTVALKDYTSLSNTPAQLQLRLVQIVVAGIKNQRPLPRDNKFLSKIRRPFLGAPHQEETLATESCSIIEEVTQSVILSGPGRDGSVDLPFSIAIPVNTPGSTNTLLGKITYSIIATISTPEAEIITIVQPLRLTRHLIPDRHCIQNRRSYPKSTVIKEITLSQNLTTDPKSEISLSANISLRRVSPQSQRNSEFRCPTIRAIHWRVEEVTRLVDQNNNDLRDTVENLICKKEVVREICGGKQKGYWSSNDNPLLKKNQKSEEDSTVEIALDISIPKNGNMGPAIDGSCYASFQATPNITSQHNENEDLIILVEQRLRVEFVTGEDTFDARNRNLVDRRPLQPTPAVKFPLLAGSHVKTDFEDLTFSGPPRYEDITMSPPEYITLV
ncbi:hypothetical protein N7488_009428 [Penicillium malachiteum]|nr:hypothetical protein N7488_009428 [Penicillium malachiteum]